MNKAGKALLLACAVAIVGALGATAQAGNTAVAADTALIAAPSVRLSATPTSLTYPSIVTLTAVAQSVDATAAHYEVRSADSTAWEYLGRVDSASGQFRLNYFPKKNSYYRVTVGSAESTPEVYVPVHTLLSKPVGNATTLRVGQMLKLWGTIRPYHPVGDHPADVKYRLYWERWNPVTKKWVYQWSAAKSISGVVDNDTTKWTQWYVVKSPGIWRVRFYHQCPRHTATYSPGFVFKVVK